MMMLVCLCAAAQTMVQKLDKAWKQFSADPQLTHAICALYVYDGKTGKMIFDKNGRVGLAPASTQKIITSAAAFETLGKAYRFKTALITDGRIQNGVLEGNLVLKGSGDPTLGSWRWASTKGDVILNEWVAALKKAGIQKINGSLLADGSGFSYQAIPDGWIWQDVGNYYGAGAYVLNWRENQLDIDLQSEAGIGSEVNFAQKDQYVNELKAAAKGSGDNAYGYLPIGINAPLIKGSIPAGEKKFTIAVADISPVDRLLNDFSTALKKNGIELVQELRPYSFEYGKPVSSNVQLLHTTVSPALDSINYYFMRRSINLYGESLVKLMAWEKYSRGDTEKGLSLVKELFATSGISKSSLGVIDGSGLSPQNRVTAGALAQVLQWAKNKPWFSSFYHSLPEYNGMKMKSGSIGGVRSFAGYHKATDGQEYTFSIIVNNYDGSPTEIVRKIYKLLDILK